MPEQQPSQPPVTDGQCKDISYNIVCYLVPNWAASSTSLWGPLPPNAVEVKHVPFPYRSGQWMTEIWFTGRRDLNGPIVTWRNSLYEGKHELERAHVYRHDGQLDKCGDPPNTEDPNTNPYNPEPDNNCCAADASFNSDVELHSGAVIETHDLAPYQSLGVNRGLTLRYSSLQADPRPIVHFGYGSIYSRPGYDRLLIAKLSVSRGMYTQQVPGRTSDGQYGLTGNEHFWSMPNDTSTNPPISRRIDASLQVDLRSQSSGQYQYSLQRSIQIVNLSSPQFTSPPDAEPGKLISINRINSPFGSGWSLAGHQELIKNDDDSVLLIDGNGRQLLFQAPPTPGTPYISPPGDFSKLEQLSNNTFRRTLKDQTVYSFNAQNQLAQVRDRHNNLTQYLYNSTGQLSKIIDPVGLETTFTYNTNNKVNKITDPMGRITQLEYSTAGDLIKITDPDGAQYSWGYDTEHRMKTSTDPRRGPQGQVLYQGQDFYQYSDARSNSVNAGRATRAIRKDGTEVKITPVELKGLYHPNETKKLFSYNTAGDITGVIAPRPVFLTDTEAITPEAKYIDGNGHEVRTRLDQGGHAAASFDEVGALPTVERNQQHLISRSVDSRGHATTYSYDSMGNLQSIQDELVAPTYALSSGNALVFDGVDDYVRLKNAALVSRLSNSTVELWVKFDSLAIDTYQTLYSEDSSGGTAFRLYQGNGELWFAIWRSDVAGNWTTVSTPFQTVNQWVHIAVVLSAANGMRLYVDGSLVASNAAEKRPSNATIASASLGRVTNTGGRGYFQGQLDEVRLWNVARTGTQIQAQMQQSLTGTEAGLLGYWPCDQGAGTVLSDQSANDNHGTLVGGTAWADDQAAGGTALSFDGVDNAVRFNNTIGNFGTGDFTVEFWLRSTSSGTARYILGKRPAWNHSNFWEVTLLSTGKVRAAVDQDSAGTNYNAPLGNAVVTDGNWHHIAITRDAATLSIYVDAQLDVTKAGAGTANLSNTANLIMGDSPWISSSTYEQFLGQLDEVRLWNTARTQAQIKADMHQRLSGTETGLLGYWRFNEGSGTTANDATAAGHSGTLVGGTTWTSNTAPLGGSLTGYPTFSYDPLFNQLTASTDELGRQTRYQIDSTNGNVLSMTQETGATGGNDLVTRYSYTPQGLINTITDPLGRLTDYEYDNLGRLISLITAKGTSDEAIERFEYDNAGNRTALIDANGHRTQFGYDNANRLTQVKSPVVANTALAFDGVNDAVQFSNSIGNFGTGDFTVEFWVRSTSSSVIRYIIGKRLACSHGSYWDVGLTTGGKVRAAVDQNSAGLNYNVLLGSAVVTDGQWHHVAITRDAATLSILIDGQLDATNQGAGTANLSNTASLLMADHPCVGTSGYGKFQGQVDQVRLWSVARTPAQVQGSMNQSLRGTESGLLACWRCDEGSGRRVYDQTDNHHHGTLVGGPVWVDLEGSLSTPTPVEMLVTAYTYDKAGNLTKETDARNHSTQYEYGALNRRTKTIDANNGETVFGYDGAGNLKSVVDPLNHATEFRYDQRNRLIETIDPEAGQTLFEYDLDNNQTAVVDPLSHRTTQDYDARNRLIQETDPLGKRTLYHYDAVNHQVVRIDSNGNRTQWGYDALDRLTQMLDPLGKTTTTAYDAVGNQVSVTDPLGRKTQWTYDALNRPIAEIDPLNHQTTTVYDKAGNVTAVRDALNQTTQFTYDALDRQTAVIDALGKVTTTAYDAVSNVAKITDPVGNATTFIYDKLNRQTAETNALSATRSFNYDANSNLTSTTDRNGRVRSFNYDKLNRQTKEQWLNAAGTAAIRTATYIYDALSRLTAASDPDSKYAYTYNEASHLISVDNTGTPGVPGVRLNHTYDPVGNRLSVKDTIAGQLKGTQSFIYDALNRMSQITQSGNGVAEKRVNLTYDAASQMTSLSRYSNLAGTQLVATSNAIYDTAGRLGQLAHERGATTLANSTWGFNAANRVISFTSPDGSSNYNYDKTHQLMGTDHSYQTDEIYSYDANGNRNSTGYQTDANNRLLTDGKYNYEYDNEGNRTKRTEIATSQVNEYIWDYRNRLTRVVFKNAAGSITKDVRFTYDVFDRRIAKIVDPDGPGTAATKTERFVYDEDHIALTFDGNGNKTHRYLHGPEIDQILADEAAQGGVLWTLTDNQGTVRDLINGSGTSQNHLKYDSFGKRTSQTSITTDHRFGYTGRELDEETELYYYRARYYDPVVGRFISEDPIGFEAGDANLYRYVGNSPINDTDPTGLYVLDSDPCFNPLANLPQLSDSPDSQGSGSTTYAPSVRVAEGPGDPTGGLGTIINVINGFRRVWNGVKWVWQKVTPRGGPRPARAKVNEKDAKHIFRKKEGHLPDTPANRRLLEDTTSNPKNYLGPDKYGTEWYGKTLPGGRQVWTRVRNGKIINGGINQTPKTYNPETGLSSPTKPR